MPGGFAVIGNVAYIASPTPTFPPNFIGGSTAADGIVAVDLTTGNRTLISGTAQNSAITAGSGPSWTLPADVAVDSAGQLLVTMLQRMV